MYEFLIENYINNITTQDVMDFAKQNNIFLDDHELNIAYKTIKTRYKDLLGSNYEEVFKSLEQEFNPNNFKLICQLFIEYRNTFKNFLK